MTRKKNQTTLALVGALALGALALILVFATTGSVQAQTAPQAEAPAAELQVCPSGCTHSSVQAAVDAATAGDTIKVAEGTYTDVHVRASITQVVFITKSLTIQGGYTTTNWTTPDPAAHPTTLDAGGQGRVLVISDTGDVAIEGLGITGGDATGQGGIWWGDVGGGVYVFDATPVISGNLVYSNTAFAGGGVFLSYSGAILNGNVVFSNTVPTDGAGLYLWDSDAAMLNGNTIRHNISTGDGWGGGLNLTLSGAMLKGNTICHNDAGTGGGASLDTSPATLEGNIICDNTANNGGGLTLAYGPATLRDNIVTGNTAFEGGGLFLWDNSRPTLINTVVVDNVLYHAWGLGAGLYVQKSSPRLLHTTIARNSGGDGSGIHVTNSDTDYSAIVMTNTILFSHTVGITVTAGSTATLDATLWQANGTDWGGAGTIVHIHDHSGDPAFAADGYHLDCGSAAIDQGVDAGVTVDIDGEVRPLDAGYDLGADEFSCIIVYRIYLPIVIRGAQ